MAPDFPQRSSKVVTIALTNLHAQDGGQVVQ